jgi:transcription-repair coupling factor (superfamily II helicase)
MSVFYDRMATLWDYLHGDSLILWLDAAAVRKEMDERFYEIRRSWEESQSSHEWTRPPHELFEDPALLLEQGQRFRHLWTGLLGTDTPSARIVDLGVQNHDELIRRIRSHPSRERLLEPVARQLIDWHDAGLRTFLVCPRKEQAARMRGLLAAYGVEVSVRAEVAIEELGNSSEIGILVGPLEKGFTWPAERLAIVCDEELFGKRSRRAERKPAPGIFLNSFQDVQVGDLLVHVDHGIGIYRELVHLGVGGIESDFLLIEYQDGDRLYVPVDRLQKVQKYLGVEGQEPRIDKLGGRSWETTKRKARESAERVAEELLNVYALRQVNKGHAFSAPDQMFREFEATFSFEETPDQLSAIDEVIEDMMAPRPMDRLVCGDVGFGKTEVAVRAAFKAVLDGKQVAVLVPTTVLAEQHHQTFTERFAAMPIQIASFSRFKTKAQQKEVLDGLAKGMVDVVIGTHRLLQKDVVFRDLGLLVVDEEHRFGVKHKENIKKLRVSVDVLTLTATPIPRTLHMSLTGIRDLSTIDTPPQDRRAVETYVCKYDEFTIREAVYRELRRGGQVFFVHNHVQTIYHVASSLGKLVPEARVAVAHGQMRERELEKAMLDFVHKKIDVLVCTTIIESGLDIPAANTIVINRADKFGLAQIYQLRGRVGRSHEQAYAYLIIPGEHLISRDAQKRLRALMDFSELGAGFKIALNDLQIRGAGTILGSAQSGHVAAVGYELYLELIESTVRRFKGETGKEVEIDPEIQVPLSAFLPADFIPDTDQRLLAYKRLATATDEVGIDDVATEWRDRYGPFPESVRNLIVLAKLRLLLKRLRIPRLEGQNESFTLHFQPHADITELPAFIDLLERKKGSYRLESERRLSVEIWGRTLAQRVMRLKRILQEHLDHASDIKSIQ